MELDRRWLRISPLLAIILVALGQLLPFSPHPVNAGAILVSVLGYVCLLVAFYRHEPSAWIYLLWLIVMVFSLIMLA